jgi:hypothetical protein
MVGPHERLATPLTEHDQQRITPWSGPGGGTIRRFLLEVEDEPGLHLPGLHFMDRGVDVLEVAPLVDDLASLRDVTGSLGLGAPDPPNCSGAGRRRSAWLIAAYRSG